MGKLGMSGMLVKQSPMAVSVPWEHSYDPSWTLLASAGMSTPLRLPKKKGEKKNKKQQQLSLISLDWNPSLDVGSHLDPRAEPRHCLSSPYMDKKTRASSRIWSLGAFALACFTPAAAGALCVCVFAQACLEALMKACAQRSEVKADKQRARWKVVGEGVWNTCTVFLILWDGPG